MRRRLNLGSPDTVRHVESGRRRGAGAQRSDCAARRPNPARKAMKRATPTMPTAIPTQGMTKRKTTPITTSASAAPTMPSEFPMDPPRNLEGLVELAPTLVCDSDAGSSSQGGPARVGREVDTRLPGRV
jgi:hypothetical protein